MYTEVSCVGSKFKKKGGGGSRLIKNLNKQKKGLCYGYVMIMYKFAKKDTPSPVTTPMGVIKKIK